MASKKTKAARRSPNWINEDGELDTEALKTLVSKHAKKLAHGQSAEVQCGQVGEFLSLINMIWTLETHVARDSADLIANEIKYVLSHHNLTAACNIE